MTGDIGFLDRRFLFVGREGRCRLQAVSSGGKSKFREKIVDLGRLKTRLYRGLRICP